MLLKEHYENNVRHLHVHSINTTVLYSVRSYFTVVLVFCHYDIEESFTDMAY